LEKFLGFLRMRGTEKFGDPQTLKTSILKVRMREVILRFLRIP